MRDKNPHLSEDVENIPAGYTYFGQFIDHDMTWEGPLTSIDHSIEPGDTPNRRTCWLNLDSIYGSETQVLQAGAFEDDGRFRLSDVLSPAGARFDVPLDDSCVPLVADPRNIENAIVRQVHAMFLKLHNLAMETEPDFESARLRVCQQYQWLVVNDFVSTLCQARKVGEPIIDWQDQFSIPVEFARAGFRFGHSMVRDRYELAEIGSTIDLLDLFGGEDSRGALLPEFAVPWSNFLRGRNASSSETALPIDTSVVSPLFCIPNHSARLFAIKTPQDECTVLPHLTLQRGAASSLPTGQCVRELLGAAPIPADPEIDRWRDLKACGLAERTPLWYYILLEAEAFHSGQRLGPVGSFIVREVIEGALYANPDSYLCQHGADWSPEPWKVNDSEQEVRTFLNLASVVGLAD